MYVRSLIFMTASKAKVLTTNRQIRDRKTKNFLNSAARTYLDFKETSDSGLHDTGPSSENDNDNTTRLVWLQIPTLCGLIQSSLYVCCIYLE